MEDFISGCIGGIIGTGVVYPFDTYRIRQQTNNILKRNLFSGVLAPMLGIGLEKALVFGSYNYTKKYVDSDFLCGLVSGFFASLVVTPVEKWKIIKQNNPEVLYRHIIPKTLKKGVGNIYNGLSACFLREIPGYAIYFQTYSILKKNDLLVSKYGCSSYIATLLYGGLSGLSSWACIYPFDTIKTNMQYNNTRFYETYKDLLKNGRLFKGYRMGLIRAFLLHSFVFLGYECSRDLFNLSDTYT